MASTVFHSRPSRNVKRKNCHRDVTQINKTTLSNVTSRIAHWEENFTGFLVFQFVEKSLSVFFPKHLKTSERASHVQTCQALEIDWKLFSWFRCARSVRRRRCAGKLAVSFSRQRGMMLSLSRRLSSWKLMKSAVSGGDKLRNVARFLMIYFRRDWFMDFVSAFLLSLLLICIV